MVRHLLAKPEFPAIIKREWRIYLRGGPLRHCRPTLRMYDIAQVGILKNDAGKGPPRPAKKYLACHIGAGSRPDLEIW